MMLKYHLGDGPWKINAFQDIETCFGMCFYKVKLDFGDDPGFTQNLRGDRYFADIMNHGSHAGSLHPLI